MAKQEDGLNKMEFKMNQQTNLTALFPNLPDHHQITNWQTSHSADGAIASMMVSARSKKQGRVLKRLSKHTGTLFPVAHVLTWEKGSKTVYMQAQSIGELNQHTLSPDSQEALFLTSLTMVTDDINTMLDIQLCAAISHKAVYTLAKNAFDRAEFLADCNAILRSGRIFSKGLSLLGETQPSIPIFISHKNVFLELNSVGVKYDNNGEPDQYYFSVISAIHEICDPKHVAQAASLKQFLSPETYPGDEVFAETMRTYLKN